MINQAKSGYRQHVQTFRQMTSDTKHSDSLLHSVRNDVANRYHDVMYGDGTIGSFERQNLDDYER